MKISADESHDLHSFLWTETGSIFFYDVYKPPLHMPHHKSDTEKHGHTTKTEKLELGGPLHTLLCKKLINFIEIGGGSNYCKRIAGQPSLCDIIEDHCQ